MRQKVSAAAVAAELLPGVGVPLLKDLHLLTRDGDLNADSRRKLKQVNHLVRLLEPAVRDVLQRFPEPVIVDCGAGKSALGFLLAGVFLRPAGRGTVIGVEARPELARGGEERAARLAVPHLRFLAAEVESAPVPERVHLVTALHACDTATDDALLLALRRGADHVAVVPCCQAEVARQLAESGREAPEPWRALWQHPWHRREIGSHLSNVIRALVLEAHGYQVTVTELAGWEHSLKNELILARRVHRESRPARARLDALLAATGVRPKLVRGLDADAHAHAGAVAGVALEGEAAAAGPAQGDVAAAPAGAHGLDADAGAGADAAAREREAEARAPRADVATAPAAAEAAPRAPRADVTTAPAAAEAARAAVKHAE